MPTRLRVDVAGYHHVINRGVNRGDVFHQPTDKEMFLQIINKAATLHKVIVHDYCLMDNHYHMLIETQRENLPVFMRLINANYAKYFNKKYKRSGHLWQDRYKSRFVISEAYLYTLIRYIENNPIEAKLAEKVGEYPYTLASVIMRSLEGYPCCNESIMLTQFDLTSLHEFLDVLLSQEERKFLKEKEKQKVIKSEEGIVMKRSQNLEAHFQEVNTKTERNLAIINAYLDGHTQADIAKHLNLSKSLISKIAKSGDSLSGV